jgi:hypothetical protein
LRGAFAAVAHSRYEIVTSPAAFVMRSSCSCAHSGRMDVLAIALGIVMFAILLVMIEGIDRI